MIHAFCFTFIIHLCLCFRFLSAPPPALCMHLFPDCVSTPVLHHPLISLNLFPSFLSHCQFVASAGLVQVFSRHSLVASDPCCFFHFASCSWKPLPDLLDLLTVYRAVLKIKDLFSPWFSHCCLLFMTKIQRVQFSLKLWLCLVNPAKKQPHTPTELRTPPLGVIRIASGCTTGMENQFCFLRLYFCVGWCYQESGAAGMPRFQDAKFKFSAFKFD